ncbi:Nn.00g092940.m01.CDS01 [Neocucurbitaria sp. VM-36]
MDGPRRRVEAATRPLSSEHYHHGPARSLSSTSTDSVSLWETVLYTLRLILEVSSTVGLLTLGVVIPEVRNWITSIGMGKKFDPDRDIGSLEGKIVLVTGGNAGLGKQTIAYLAPHKPARIYLAARTASKARDAIADIRSTVPNACEIIHLPLDLTSFSSIAEAAATFQARESRLDILINNAGIMACPYDTTKEGYENQFGTNHMGHALLTKLLLPTLLDTAKQPGADVRVISLSSMGHHLAGPGGINFDQRALEQQNTWRRYGASKLANILYARELAAQYPQITSISLHPGVILTDLYQSLRANFFLKIGVWIYGFLAMVLPGHYKDTKGGALNTTWCATVEKEELVNGAFYNPVGKKNAGSKWARDEGLQKKLWEWTEAELERHGY